MVQNRPHAQSQPVDTAEPASPAAARGITEEARRLAAEYATFAEIGRVINSSPNIYDIYEGFAEQVHKLLPFERLVINSVDATKGTMVTLYQSGVNVPEWAPGMVREMSGSPTEWVVKNRQSLLLSGDTAPEERDRFGNQDPSVRAGLLYLVAVPLLSKNEVIGTLHFRSSKADAYTPECVLIAERVASQIAGAIDNSLLYTEQISIRATLEDTLREARELAEENALIGEVGRIISSSLDISEVYDAFADAVSRLIPFDRITIALANETDFERVNIFIRGVEVPEFVEGAPAPITGTSLESVVRDRTSVLDNAEDIDSFLRTFPALGASITEGLRAMLTAPLISRGEIIGGLIFRSKQAGIYTERHRNIAENICAQMAGAVANSRLYATQLETQKALEESLSLEHRLAQEQSLFAQIGRTISSSMEINEVYEDFADQVQSLITFDRISLALLVGDSETLVNAYVQGVEAEGRRVGERFSIIGTPAEGAIGKASAILVQGSYDELKARYPRMVFSNMRSVVMAPLIFNNEPIGLLNVRSLTESAYGERDVEMLSLVARQIAPAIANSQLYAQQRRLATFPMHNPNPIVEANLDGSIAYCNPIARQRFPNLADLGSKHPLMVEIDTIVEDLTTRGGFHSREVDVGEETYQQRIVYIPATNQIRIYSNDITPRKRAQEKLAQQADELARSNAELQEFAYVASHDLQEPLRVISGFTQLLSDRYSGELDETADEFIGYVVDGTERMKILINDLLEYSRVGTRGRPLEPVESSSALEHALSNLQVTIKERKAKVTHERMPRVQGDINQLSQLFQNLISNGMKFCDEKRPEIHISSVQVGESWVMSVSDNGIGIDPQHNDRIFGMFKRLHGRGEYPGTGIGLAICSKIVERHTGKIWVESEPGNGATFSFTLPVAED